VDSKELEARKSIPMVRMHHGKVVIVVEGWQRRDLAWMKQAVRCHCQGVKER